jgi:fructose-1,6-bisphosphatase/inositol monophosphatase family enzyme
VQDFVTHLGNKDMLHPEPLMVSGAGEKSLRIILRSENEGLWFSPKAGTSLWDVAASDAILRTMGGRLTDKHGNEMDYSKSQEEALNQNGVIACYDEKLHAECIRLFMEGSWTAES